MKIAVISDTHGDTLAWQKALKVFEGAGIILHSGDILYHGVFNPILESYNGKQLAQDLNDCPVPMLFAKGNCDSDVDQLALKYPITSLITEAFIDGFNILLHHGDKYSNKELADKYNPSIIISGHTHIYAIEKYKDTVFLNPGSPSLPKDPNKTPTVAIIEDRKIRVIDINSLEILTEEYL